jgi:hypothetical protein
VLVIQIVAAVLLLLGSALIFRALVEMDAPTRLGTPVRPRPRPIEPEADVRLPRAA